MPDWFQGRELVEALAIRLAILAGRDDAIRMLSDAALRADAQDPYAAALLTAEFGATLAGDAIRTSWTAWFAATGAVRRSRRTPGYGNSSVY